MIFHYKLLLRSIVYVVARKSRNPNLFQDFFVWMCCTAVVLAASFPLHALQNATIDLCGSLQLVAVALLAPDSHVAGRLKASLSCVNAFCAGNHLKRVRVWPKQLEVVVVYL